MKEEGAREGSWMKEATGAMAERWKSRAIKGQCDGQGESDESWAERTLSCTLRYKAVGSKGVR